MVRCISQSGLELWQLGAETSCPQIGGFWPIVRARPSPRLAIDPASGTVAHPSRRPVPGCPAPSQCAL